MPQMTLMQHWYVSQAPSFIGSTLGAMNMALVSGFKKIASTLQAVISK